MKNMKSGIKEDVIMKRQIRMGVWETNSSLCHSLTMCTKEQFEKWKNGEIWWNRWDEVFTPTDKDEDCITYEEFKELEYEEVFEQEYTTPNGEIVIAFGYSGYDY